MVHSEMLKSCGVAFNIRVKAFVTRQIGITGMGTGGLFIQLWLVKKEKHCVLNRIGCPEIF